MNETRRAFLKHTLAAGAGLAVTGFVKQIGSVEWPMRENQRPNILFVISDDQSFPHASAYGCEAIHTPAFDRVAKEGVLFSNCIASSPGSAPSRASLLTGRNQWQLGPTGVHGGVFLKEYVPFTSILKDQGYFVGSTGKGWGPGNCGYEHAQECNGATPDNDRLEYNPAGRGYNAYRFQPGHGVIDPPLDPENQEFGDKCTYNISTINYAKNFEHFLDEKPQDRPFFFWFGAHEPHERYTTGAGIEIGLDLNKVDVPGFLPDAPEIRRDMLDYFYEIMWFDAHLGHMLYDLEKRGMLENTIVIVTSDNGMPFGRAKANLYEYGIHMPLAVCWGREVTPNRVVDDLVGFTDFAPTILELAGIDMPKLKNPMIGKSFANILLGEKTGVTEPERTAVFSSREQHASARYDGLGYPQRSIRTQQYLYIRNFKPGRWPAGAPHKLVDGRPDTVGRGYYDIDDYHIEYTWLHRHDKEVAPYFHLAVDKRPAEELYDIQSDPACLDNLALKAEFQDQLELLRKQLNEYLTRTNDPRMRGEGDILESWFRNKSHKFPEPDRTKTMKE